MFGVQLSRKPLSFSLALASLFVVGGATAAKADHACGIDLTVPTWTCTYPVSVNAFGGNQALLVARLSGYTTMVVRVDACNPTGFSVNIGDSPTNDGGGGDKGSTQHDAEVQINGLDFSAFKSDYNSGEQYRGVGAAPSGCSVQQFLLRNDYAEFDPNVNLAGDYVHQVPHWALFDFPFYDEYDAEDPNGYQAEVIFIGLNRVVDLNMFPSRTGTGVRRACVYLSTAFYPNLSNVTAACGF